MCQSPTVQLPSWAFPTRAGAGFTAAPGLGLDTPVPPLMGQRCTNAHAVRTRQPTLVSWHPSERRMVAEITHPPCASGAPTLDDWGG
eukprot:4076913-Pyramimonas_sp.AAC.1